METTEKTIDDTIKVNTPDNAPKIPEGASCDASVCHTETQRERGTEDHGPVYVPAVDVVEGENEVTVIADVPGVVEGGVDLMVEKNILTLSATPAEAKIEGKTLAYSEYGVGEYRCSFSLSDEINRENISASLKDGVLSITLPKSAPVMKKISVAAS